MNRPYDANVVADYIILQLTSEEKPSDLINLKLQKLLYYVQGWFLGYQGSRMIDSSFEAWVHGPVCSSVYDRFTSTKSLYSFISKDDVKFVDAFDRIEKEDRDFIDYVLMNYAGFSGVELEQKTHDEKPWVETRAGLDPMTACTKEISDALMIEFFGDKWRQIYGE